MVALVLLVCFACPLIEMFDQWDHTAQTGSDTEYTFVVLALCIGVAYTLAKVRSQTASAHGRIRVCFESSCKQDFHLAKIRFLLCHSYSL